MQAKRGGRGSATTGSTAGRPDGKRKLLKRGFRGSGLRRHRAGQAGSNRTRECPLEWWTGNDEWEETGWPSYFRDVRDLASLFPLLPSLLPPPLGLFHLQYPSADYAALLTSSTHSKRIRGS